jgi:acetyl-CoA C-acetyltransferase
MNPNTPVIVGIAQILNRDDDVDDALEPVDMMVEAVREAALDTGSSAILEKLESIGVVKGAWHYDNAAAYVAEKVGAPGAETIGTAFGGNMVQSTLNTYAREILAGERSVAVVTGAEHGRTRARSKKQGLRLEYRPAPGKPDRFLGNEDMMASEAEMTRGIGAPIQMYPIIENAIRYNRGETIEAHAARISQLWAGFNEVATHNPHAWLREPLTAEQIRTPSSANRMVSFPYTKYMNSNSAVNMASAVIICSVASAEQMGIPRSQWVFPWAGTEANDHYFMSERDNLHSSPAIRFAGERVLALSDLSVDDLDLVDVYSCFPSAVQISATEIGLSQDRPLTVTGGLTFGGGPLNNYVMHSISRMVELLRDNPGKRGLVTSNGGYITKHAFCIYSTEPPEKDFQWASLQAEVDATPKRDWLVSHDGDVTIESYTVMYKGDRPSIGHAACLLPDGRRTWANLKDEQVLQEMTEQEFCGRPGHLDSEGWLTVKG